MTFKSSVKGFSWCFYQYKENLCLVHYNSSLPVVGAGGDMWHSAIYRKVDIDY
jgi:hypothetical protein